MPTSTTDTMPAVYLPHGGGPAFFMHGPMHDMFQGMQEFLASFDTLLPRRPSAILVVTAHWESDVVTVTGGARPELIYDYYGFPEDTYFLSYPAPGAPELAARTAGLLQGAGIAASVDPGYGWDHGVFIPLKVMYPQAEIPVVAISLQTGLDPDVHAAIGAALAPLRDDDVLIVGSGMSYHNLRGMLGGGATPHTASLQFDRWLDGALRGDASHRSAQLATWSKAPSGRDAHPREEHLMPLMVASGAGGDQPGEKWWSGPVGDTTVSAWAFR
jgi:aromatic ring-opening dioxygenase catalytic subunit (LigB family)